MYEGQEESLDAMAKTDGTEKTKANKARKVNRQRRNGEKSNITAKKDADENIFFLPWDHVEQSNRKMSSWYDEGLVGHHEGGEGDCQGGRQRILTTRAHRLLFGKTLAGP